jgi:hydrogenase expression/formation protein HypC
MCVSVIGQVRAVDGERSAADVEVDGRRRSTSLVVLEVEGITVAPGDWVLVHTGFAVEVLDPTDAMALVAELRAARATSEPVTDRDGR